MSDTWETLGNEAAAVWNIKWATAKRNAGLTVMASNTYSNLIRSAPDLGNEIATTLRERATAAVAGIQRSASIGDIDQSAAKVVAPLDAVVFNSLRDTAREYDERRAMAGIAFAQVAVVEAEKVSLVLAAIRESVKTALRNKRADCLANEAKAKREQRNKVIAIAIPVFSSIVAWIYKSWDVGAIVGGVVAAGTATIYFAFFRNHVSLD